NAGTRTAAVSSRVAATDRRTRPITDSFRAITPFVAAAALSPFLLELSMAQDAPGPLGRDGAAAFQHAAQARRGGLAEPFQAGRGNLPPPPLVAAQPRDQQGDPLRPRAYPDPRPHPVPPIAVFLAEPMGRQRRQQVGGRRARRRAQADRRGQGGPAQLLV